MSLYRTRIAPLTGMLETAKVARDRLAAAR
jgi:hypothetical protein